MVDATGRLSRSAVDELHARLDAALKHLGVGGEVRVRIVGDAEMAQAHQRHLGVPGTTDVITFDLAASDGPEVFPILDADLLICLDEAGRQARARGTSVERELLLYAVHGVLHCLGHDDHEPDDARRMHEREDQILSAVGVPPTYAAEPCAGDASNTHDAGVAGAVSGGTRA